MSKSSIGWRKAGISSLATAALVAGACVAGAGAANANTNFAFQRLQGPDRYGTSAAVAEAFGSASNVIMASGLSGHYADALAANYLAGVKNAPVVLTKKDSTPSAVLAAIHDSGAKDVWIVGGTDVISQAQEDSLTSAGYTVHRLAGADRYATDTAVINAAGTSSSGEAIVATGLNFPDALGAGPLSFAKDMPLAISKTKDISDAEIAALKNAGVTKVLVAGGTDVVSDAVVAKLAANGIVLDQRFAGTDRADTAAQIAKYELANGFTNTAVNVASGYQLGDGADALGGAALSGKNVTPMLITKDVVHPGQATLAYLTNNANTLASGNVFGGPQAVADGAVSQMEKSAQAVSSNQTYSVTGGSSTATSGQVLQYTVTGIGTEGVNIALVDASQVSTNPNNGVVTFKGTNSGGSGNAAILTQTNGATVTVVNGSTGSSSSEQDGVKPTGGAISFTVKTGSGDFVPVVFSNADNNATLELNADGTPKESFGVGQQTTIVAAEAADASSPTGTVTAYDKTANFFETAAATYYYDSNDVFQVSTDAGKTYSTVTMDQFESALSDGDTLNGLIYRTDAANQSTFRLNDVAPAAPAVAAAPEADNKGGVKVTVTAAGSSAGNVVSYNVYRATATKGTITGQSATCPAVGSAYTKVGSIDPTKGMTFDDRTAQAPATGQTQPQYCYYATAVDNSGEESGASNVAGPITAEAATTTTTTAPAFKAGAVDTSGTALTATYTEDVDATTVDAGDFKVVYTPNGSNTSYNLTVTKAVEDAVTAGNVDITVTLPAGVTPGAGDVYIVTAQKGTDTPTPNTVGDTNTGASQQFQAVGDQLYIKH